MKRALLVGALLGACTAAPDLSPVESEVLCDVFYCGTNGPIVVGFPFGELNEQHLMSPEGFRIIQTYAPNGDLVELDVTGPWPRIVWPSGMTKSGSQMVGTTIRLQTPNPVPNHQVTLRLTDFQLIPYYDGLPGPRIAAFDVEYLYFEPKVGTWINAELCPYETVDAQGIADSWAIFSQGDRFSKTASIVATGAAVGGWFNLSCAGSVPGKLLRIRHAKAAEDATHKTELDQREAALRMFTAKYCEDGLLYTIVGQPLTWEDYAPWNTPVESHPEAIWTAKGAYCLVEPRYVDPKEILCDIPQCTDAELADWRTHGWLMSSIPD
ncbi:MAG: ADYC domain-containing protein [Kofleriaceae bacterium]